jgi:hypothetical protein
MSKFYIKYVPPRRGLDMVEYLEDYLTSVNSTVTFSPAFYDNMGVFGILDGEGDDLSNVIRNAETRSGLVRFTSEEFAGASVHAFVPYSGPSDPGQPGYIPPAQRPNWVTWLAAIGITVLEGDQLDCAKYYKTALLKEIAKKHFYDDNDSIADLSKAVMAIVVHYPDMNITDRDKVDNQVAVLKSIYTKDVAIDGLTELTNHLSAILVAYYTAKVEVAQATTLAEVNAVVYE